VSFLNHDNFQTSILFLKNNCHHWGPSEYGSQSNCPRCSPLIWPCTKLFKVK